MPKELTPELAAAIEKLLPEASRRPGVTIEGLRSIARAALKSIVSKGRQPTSIEQEAYNIIMAGLDLWEASQDELARYRAVRVPRPCRSV